MTKINALKISFSSNSIQQNKKDNLPYENAGKKPALEKLIKESSELENNSKKSFFKNLINSPSITIISLLPLLTGEIVILNKLTKIKKQIKNSSISKEDASIYIKKIPKKLLILAASAIPAGFAVNLLNEHCKVKHNQNAIKIVDNFNEENKTNIMFKIQPTGSLIISALADPVSAQIVLDEKISEDLIFANIHLKPNLKHELVHMKQYILMARSENGVEKLNYLIVKKLANSLDNNGKKEVYDIHQEIKDGVNDKYKNANIDRFGYKLNIIDYITALYKVIYEKNTNPKDIPIIINKDFYQQVIKNKGKLTPQEEKKAQAYFEAYENYPEKIGLEAYLPNSDYRQNLMEKEAFKMNPWYTL